MSGLYSVKITEFAEKHFVKKFRKKYKQNWEKTEESIIAMYERVDSLIEKKRANVICDVNGVRIIKSEFRIFGSDISAKSSGNRCIAACCVEGNTVQLLLLYSKNDISTRNETAEWKNMIRDNYPGYRDLLK